jgi:hypothetical protein
VVAAVLSVWSSDVYCGRLMFRCGHFICIFCTECFGVLIQILNCWLEVGIQKVLRPATLTQDFLRFPVSKIGC